MRKLVLPSAVLVAAALLTLAPRVQADPPAKQVICHKDGKGEYKEIEVADKAADEGHQKHGDHLPQGWFADTDGDGFGAGESKVSCTQPAGWVPSGNDCDASNKDVHPGADEVCGDNVDNDCDGETDEGCVTEPPMSHQVEVLLHCDGNSPVIGTYGVGTHVLPWDVQRNISTVRFVGGTTGKATLKNCDGRTMEITGYIDLCSTAGGCCGWPRWNDRVCEITVE